MAALANNLTEKEKNVIYRERGTFLKNDPKFPRRFLLCTDEGKKWILNYLSSGKGTIPYELITQFDSLDIVPGDGDFFHPHQFFSSLKDNPLSEEEYKKVKNFYKTLKLKDLGELNKIYNFQDTIILCVIFEQRSCHLQEIFKYNPRKCSSASSFSGCVQREESKCCIALPTNAEHVRLFEKTLTGGFSCVNKRLAFGTDILLDNKRNEKVLFDLIIDSKKQTKRISSKILKMDKKNQYDMAMTKPLPFGCIKKKENPPTLVEFSRILDTLSRDNNIGHSFIVDIKFHNVNSKTLLFNELYPPIFEKD